MLRKPPYKVSYEYKLGNWLLLRQLALWRGVAWRGVQFGSGVSIMWLTLPAHAALPSK